MCTDFDVKVMMLGYAKKQENMNSFFKKKKIAYGLIADLNIETYLIDTQLISVDRVR